MSKTRGQIKADIQVNLTNLNLNFYSDDDLNQSIQDAYDDIAILTQCIQKKVTLSWISNLSYYNFVNLGVTDYLGPIAIFNNVTHMWLRDDLSLKDFDRLRRDWEMWIGSPQFWAPSDFKNIAIAAKYYLSTINSGAFSASGFSSGFYIGNALNALGTFILYYWGVAPTLTADTNTFLVATDKDQMLTQYATADLLEQAQEYTKAGMYWAQYFENIEEYADRVKRNCKSDLLLRI